MRRSLRFLLFSLLVLAVTSPMFAAIAISVSFGPPSLPVYSQPICPSAGYIWTPGYWAWDPDYGYYWVPGTWVLAPQVGYLWTPPWWGWENNAYFFHAGYWGPQVGFYGGINYGFGYFGDGFSGGRWQGDRFYYNRSVTNINVVNIHNVYNETIVNRGPQNRVSFNGGRGGIQMRPTAAQEAFARGQHMAPIGVQTAHLQEARQNPQLRASFNQGKPPIAATARPNTFTGSGAVAARAAGGAWHAPTSGPGTRPAYPSHARELDQHTVTRPDTGNPAQDQRFQQQQQQLAQRQNQEHQQLVQQQTREDQRAQQQNYNQQRTQQMEQQHQQQTRQMVDRHVQQSEQMQTRQMGGFGGGHPGGGRPR